MTTYTLTQAQFEVLDKTWDKCEIAHILRSLKPTPAPISKEDMVKVLEALKEYGRAGVGHSTDWHVQLSALRMATEAITIMQSAIEGMK